MTTADKQRLLAKERWFFFYMSTLVLTTVVAGFGSQLVTGRTWFTDFPWQVHVHVTVFSSWIILYVAQNWLVATGRGIVLHRRLGWIGVAIATVMVPLGIAGTIAAVARGSITGIFPLGLFLALDILHILAFGALTFAAVRLRNQPSWHKRLMLCGTILLTAPALSRLFGYLHLGGFMPLAVIAAMLLFVLAGTIFDLAVLRRIHPAYFCGLATILLVELLIVPLGSSAPVVAFAHRLAG